MKPKYSGCDFPITFHQFFLQNSHHEKFLLIAEKRKSMVLLKKKKKSSNILEICEGIVMLVAIFFTSAEIFFDGVIDWADYFFIGLFSLSFIGYIIYK